MSDAGNCREIFNVLESQLSEALIAAHDVFLTVPIMEAPLLDEEVKTDDDTPLTELQSNKRARTEAPKNAGIRAFMKAKATPTCAKSKPVAPEQSTAKAIIWVHGNAYLFFLVEVVRSVCTRRDACIYICICICPDTQSA